MIKENKIINYIINTARRHKALKIIFLCFIVIYIFMYHVALKFGEKRKKILISLIGLLICIILFARSDIFADTNVYGVQVQLSRGLIYDSDLIDLKQVNEDSKVSFSLNIKNDYILDGIYITDAKGKKINAYYNEDTHIVSFTMPNSAINVRITAAHKLYDGIYVAVYDPQNIEFGYAGSPNSEIEIINRTEANIDVYSCELVDGTRYELNANSMNVLPNSRSSLYVKLKSNLITGTYSDVLDLKIKAMIPTVIKTEVESSKVAQESGTDGNAIKTLETQSQLIREGETQTLENSVTSKINDTISLKETVVQETTSVTYADITNVSKEVSAASKETNSTSIYETETFQTKENTSSSTRENTTLKSDIQYKDVCISYCIDISDQVKRQVIKAVLFPKATNLAYGQKLKDSILTELINADGNYQWVDADVYPDVNNDGYPMIFIPFDKDNYDYSKIEGYDAKTGNVVQNIRVDVSKAKLLIKLPDKSIKLNEKLPVAKVDEFQYIGLLNGNTPEVLSGLRDIPYNVISSSAPVICTTYDYPDVKADNYEVVFKDGTLTIENPLIETVYSPVMSLKVPTIFVLTIDPYSSDRKGQIYSENIPFVNTSNVKVKVLINKLDCEINTNDELNKDCTIYINTSDGRKIQLLNGKNLNVCEFVLEPSENAEGKNASYIYFTGMLSSGSEKFWNSDDIKVNIIYDMSPVE